MNSLRRNWYLMAAAAALLLAALYLWNSPFYPASNTEYRGYVIYPLMLAASLTSLLLCIALTVAFALVVIRVALRQNDAGEGWRALTLLILAPTLLVSATFGVVFRVQEWVSLVAFSLVVVVLFLVALLMLARNRSDSRRAREGLFAVGMMLFASMFACIACGSWGLSSLEHADSARLGERTFHLAIRTDSDFDCSDRFYVLYECDAAGWLCRQRESGVLDFACLASLAEIEVALLNDPTLNVLYIQLPEMSVRYPPAPIVPEFF